MPRIYLETSFISACVTTRTDPASTYRRRISQDRWSSQRPQHELVLSAEVIRELADPRYPASDPAMALVDGLPLLALDADVLGFATLLVRERVMPGPALGGDAVHVAAAAVHGVPYLLSWNVRHLANANKQVHLRTVCVRAGLLPPSIVTPDQLWEPGKP